MNESSQRSSLSSEAPRPSQRPAAPLTTLVRLATLQQLQDHFAAVGRMTVAIYTVEGDPITSPSWGSRFSELVGTSAVGRRRFTKTIRARLQPEGSVTGLSTSCLDGMNVYLSPIVHEDRRLAMIVVGTRTHPVPDAQALDQIAATYRLDREDLSREAEGFNPFRGGTPDAIHRFADVLAHMIATLYGQAQRIESQLADLRALHRLSNLLMGTQDLQEILDLTVQQVVEIMEVKACAIRLLEEHSGELVLKAVCNLSDEYLRKGPVMLRDNVIDATAFTGETVYIEDAATDPRIRYPQNAHREGIVSGLCMPLTYRGKTVGVIRAYSDRRRRFSESEQSLLRSLGSQSASAIINRQLFEQNTKAERVQRQVTAAGQIQRRMLPEQLPQYDHLSIGCAYVPTLEVSGDFYDFIELPEREWGVCIADVVGKGLPAALMMASIRSAVRAYAQAALPIPPLMEAVNRHMCRDTLVGEFATMVYGVLSADGRMLTYCNAGHPPPLVLRGNHFLELDIGGTVIGTDPDEVFPEATFAFQPGDILVMTTDGVLEAMDFDSRAYGVDRLRRSIRRHRALEACQLAKQILWDVRRFAGLADQSDDITIVVVRAT